MKFSLLLLVCYFANGTILHINNFLNEIIWVGIIATNGSQILANGGFVLQENQSYNIEVQDNWSGKFWARTKCNSKTKLCQTGNCNRKIECGTFGNPPMTVIELRLNSLDIDQYGVSLTEGFNVPASITPIGGLKCNKSSCLRDINLECKEKFIQLDHKGAPIGCHSCDNFCRLRCRKTKQTCSPEDYEENSIKYLNSMCPDAITNNTLKFSCKATSYNITFGYN